VTVIPSGTCTFDVAFHPLALGPLTGSVGIPSDAATSPDSVSLSGNGYIAQILRVRSNGVNDGTVRESSELSGISDWAGSTSEMIAVGDDYRKRQYIGILDFNTSNLPDNAVITSVKLQVKVMILSNGIYTSLGDLLADVTNPYFGNIPGLQTTDFHSRALANNVGTFTQATDGNQWITLFMKPASLFAVNKTGQTQFRVHFALDDNNDAIKHQIGFLSGDYTVVADRPLLVITHYIPQVVTTSK
jgi:hypothetical protein